MTKTLLMILPSLAVAAMLVGESRAANSSSPSSAGAEAAAYWNTVTQRAAKIIGPLGIDDAAKAARVRDVIARQYVDLRDLHARRDAAIAAAASNNDAERAVRDNAARETYALHVAFVARLAAELTPAQVDQVKDGLTYHVLPGTYQHYLELYPGLTEQQRLEIRAWLIEAREYAMDGGSSEEKHRWFGTYKGKINNYLSAAGYDAKAAERAWTERQKDKRENP